MKNQTPTLFLGSDDEDDDDERAKGLICGVVREKIDSADLKKKNPLAHVPLTLTHANVGTDARIKSRNS